MTVLIISAAIVSVVFMVLIAIDSWQCNKLNTQITIEKMRLEAELNKDNK